MLLLFLFVYSLRSLRARGCFLAFRFMPFVYPWRRRGTMRGLLGPSTLPFGHSYHCCTTCASLLTYMLIYMCYGAMSIRHSCIGLIALIRSFEHYLRVVIFYYLGNNCIHLGLLWSLPYVRFRTSLATQMWSQITIRWFLLPQIKGIEIQQLVSRRPFLGLSLPHTYDSRMFRSMLIDLPIDGSISVDKLMSVLQQGNVWFDSFWTLQLLRRCNSLAISGEGVRSFPNYANPYWVF